jgi:sensor domain CHASE-containing protein
MQKTRSVKAPLKSPASQRLLNLRTRLERAVEKAIALLDELDGDPDLEPSLAGYQPWLHDHKPGVQCLDLEADY